jgi:hypothetical protein
MLHGLPAPTWPRPPSEACVAVCKLLRPVPSLVKHVVLIVGNMSLVRVGDKIRPANPRVKPLSSGIFIRVSLVGVLASTLHARLTGDAGQGSLDSPRNLRVRPVMERRIDPSDGFACAQSSDNTVLRAFRQIFDLSTMKGARAFDWPGTPAESSSGSTRLGHSKMNIWASCCGWVLDVKLLQGLIVYAKLQGMTELPLMPIGKVAKVGRCGSFRSDFKMRTYSQVLLACLWQV